MPEPVLSRRALNRALLARQMLLERVDLSIDRAVEHLVALQAQEPWDPYYQLWSRLQRFDPFELAQLLEERRVVRATSMLRTTIHLMTAEDWLALRPVLQAVSERGFATGSPFGRQLAGMDIEEVLTVGREALAEGPLTAAQLRTILGERWPDRDATALAYAVRYLVPLVQTTPRAVWGKRGQPVLATAGLWLGREVGTETDPTDLILRYLRAFGPASVMDSQAWSWLTRLTPYVEALRPMLRTFRDENGKELFDVPDGLLPDAEAPAPPRFLPTYDNVVLGHKDRSRIVGDPERDWVKGKAQWDHVFQRGSILVDGFVAAGWRQEREEKSGTASVVVMPVLRRSLTAAERDAVDAEARALLTMAAPDASAYDVRFETGR
ncbi:MAG TPA: winged helix DNA-binding domain-containing protein [Candidatus Limnocylindrales bacterium]|nr:winged helix DNA-binding domain-containing protein [Candidatus Limnocylindrales bacterium]